MQDSLLKLIPFKIGRIPENIDVDSIKGFLESIGFEYGALKLKVQNKLSFIDCGENLKSVKCNFCSSDASEWWSEYMTNSFENNYENRMIVTPCCNMNTSLEDLIYDHDIGFSKFILEVINPNRILSDDELVRISDLFGCVMKIIDARVINNFY